VGSALIAACKDCIAGVNSGPLEELCAAARGATHIPTTTPQLKRSIHKDFIFIACLSRVSQ